MYKFWQKTIQVLSILTLIGTAIFLFWLYKIGILNDQNVLSDLIKSQGALGSLSFQLFRLFKLYFRLFQAVLRLLWVSSYFIFGGDSFSIILEFQSVVSSFSGWLVAMERNFVSSSCLKIRFTNMKAKLIINVVMKFSLFSACFLPFLQLTQW